MDCLTLCYNLLFPFPSLAFTQPHLILLSPYYLATLSPHHPTTPPPRNHITLSPCHSITLSPCHPVTLTHHHYVITLSTKAPYWSITLSSSPRPCSCPCPRPCLHPRHLTFSLSSSSPRPHHLVLSGPRSLDLYLDPRVSYVSLVLVP